MNELVEIIYHNVRVETTSETLNNTIEYIVQHIILKYTMIIRSTTKKGSMAENQNK